MTVQQLRSQPNAFQNGYMDTKLAMASWDENLGYTKYLYSIKLRSAAESNASKDYQNGVCQCLHDLGFD